jgi:hypothetical protein
MLKPITNWKALRRALRAQREAIYTCLDCGHVWIASALKSPLKCTREGCRALANSPRRTKMGRPRTAEVD